MSSIEFIERYEGTKSVYVRKNESKIDRFKKLSHLHLNGKRINKIVSILLIAILILTRLILSINFKCTTST